SSGSPSSLPSGVSGCTTSSRHPLMVGCLTVETAWPTTTPICIASPAKPQAALEYAHPARGRGAARLPRERQRRRHALAGRRRDAEAQVALAAAAQPGRARPVLHEDAHVQLAAHPRDRLDVPRVDDRGVLEPVLVLLRQLD